MLVLLDDGETLSVGPEETEGQQQRGDISCSCPPTNSLAGVVAGVLRTVSRAVAAQEAGGVLRGNCGVLGFDPRPL